MFSDELQIAVEFHDAAGVTLFCSAFRNIDMAIIGAIADAVPMVKGKSADRSHQFPGVQVEFVQNILIVGEVSLVIGTVVDDGGLEQVSGSIFRVYARALRAPESIFFILWFPVVNRADFCGEGAA